MIEGIERWRITPQYLMDIAEPVEDVYRAIEDQILQNIAHHFKGTGSDKSASLQWQSKKLAQIGKITRENTAIIARYAGEESGMTALALEHALTKAVGAVEPDLQEAARRGLLDGTGAAPMDAAIQRQLNAYQRQAIDKRNMVNTAMLNSSLDQYRKVISNTLVYERKLTRTQEALNRRTGEVITGVSSRQHAVRAAIKDLAREGLTAFTDRAGRQWTPEAYVNMDIRTTVHNAATQAAFDRADEYGSTVIEVSSHAGARPKCAPYQGRLWDRSGKSGYIEDLNGKRIIYGSLFSTSYGQPDGLFGINCGHSGYPFIPGMSRLTYKPYDDGENAKTYKQSQKQRSLERKVRSAKREAACLKAAGDGEGFKQASAKVKQAQDNLKTFIQDTGRTRRRDREQVYGYDRSTASSVSSANRRELAKYSAYHYNKNGTIRVTDDWKGKLHQSTPKKYKPNAIVETTSSNGQGKRQIDRTYYGPDALIAKQVHGGPHGQFGKHPFGQFGEHMHTYVWGKDGQPERLTMEIGECERKENGDILDR